MRTRHNTITKQRALLFLIASLLLATSSACGSGDEGPTPTPDMTAPGQISGVLMDGNTGQPLSNVTVGLLIPTSSSGGTTFVEQTNIDTETDLSGAFLLFGVPPGEYFMFALLDDFQSLITDDTGRRLLLEVGPGQTVDLGLIEVSE